MSKTIQSDLRAAIDFMKADSGSGTKARKQERFREVYEPEVAHIVAGERYDDAGVGPATARSAAQSVYPHIDIGEHDTISEALAADAVGGSVQTLTELVSDLDSVARRSGNDQQEYLEFCLDKHAEPSLVTLALLDDESIGLGTSQMRETFFDGTRDERKRREAFTNSTQEFISLAKQDVLPDAPTVGEPFDPMLAVPESRGQPDNPLAQIKIDGYRVLIHIEDGEPTAFSRAKNDITESLPELHEIDWPDGDYIFDGEVIAETGSYSDTSERIGRKAENINRSVEMNFKLFDIVLYDGVDISRKTFATRDVLLVMALPTYDDHIEVVSGDLDIDRAKDSAMEDGDEGIIVKDLEGPYEFGKRSTHWQKQKFDSDNLDLKICGFHEGDGEGSGTLGSVEIETSDGVHLGRSGSGFSDAERDIIWNNQDEWLGRTVEIEARGLSSDHNNLRMPIWTGRDRTGDGEADSFERVREIMKEV